MPGKAGRAGQGAVTLVLVPGQRLLVGNRERAALDWSVFRNPGWGDPGGRERAWGWDSGSGPQAGSGLGHRLADQPTAVAAGILSSLLLLLLLIGLFEPKANLKL